MQIELQHLKPVYMSESEVTGSDIYLQPSVIFERGRRYMVCARSGRGKSSLLNFIYGSSLDYDGTVDYHMAVEQPSDLWQRHLSYLFQDLALFGSLTAFENVQLKNNLTHHKSDDEIERMLRQLLPAEKLHRPVSTLSWGQRQRVAAVRALCQPFDYLLLDEPFSHIDRDNSCRLAALIDSEVQKQGAGMIVTALDPIDYFHFDSCFRL